jgi:Ca2+-binding EF-hand superfamily protein
MRKQLQEEYDFEPAQIDALYDQFSALAKETPSSDVSHGSFGIDRAAFDMALTNERWRSRFRPNVIFDRMFAFYDKDSDGKIGFSDFVSGMAYLCSAKRYNPLHRAVQGYDLNGDGYVDRSDIIRLLRAKYEIQRLITADMIDALEDERNHEVVDSLRSSQPISAIFTEGDIPASQSRPIVGKTMDQYGDMQPEPRQKTILDEGERLEARRGRRQSTEHSFGGVQGDAAQNESNRGLHTYGEPGRLCSLGESLEPSPSPVSETGGYTFKPIRKNIRVFETSCPLTFQPFCL